jgi:hypothetical protein
MFGITGFLFFLLPAVTDALQLNKVNFITQSKENGENRNVIKDFHATDYPILINENKRLRLQDVRSDDTLSEGSLLSKKLCGSDNAQELNFLEQAHKVHGDKYDYSLANYIDQASKIRIICRQHGEFFQLPFNHLNHKGSGCKVCAQLLKTEAFIENAIKIHGDKYDYSLANHINHSRMTIICSQHGEFFQTALSHLRGNGCFDCGKLSTRDSILSRNEIKAFIEKANIKHNNKYDYSLVTRIMKGKMKGTQKEDYITSKVIIVCRKHGKFTQSPNSHLKGHGCKDCGHLYQRGSLHHDAVNKFELKAINIHGIKYDYSLVEYISSNKKVILVCPQHGEFTQTPHAHLHGRAGCFQCGVVSRTKKRTFSTAKFIEEATKIYGDKYDYSRVNYITTHEIVIIGCKQHGDFNKTPQNFLIGSECNECSRLSRKHAKMQLKIQLSATPEEFTKKGLK